MNTTTAYVTANEYMVKGFPYTTDANLVDYMGMIQDFAAETGTPAMAAAAKFAAAVRSTGATIISRKGKLGAGFRPDDAARVMEAVRSNG